MGYVEALDVQLVLFSSFQVQELFPLKEVFTTFERVIYWFSFVCDVLVVVDQVLRVHPCPFNESS